MICNSREVQRATPRTRECTLDGLQKARPTPVLWCVPPGKGCACLNYLFVVLFASFVVARGPRAGLGNLARRV